MPLRDIFRKKTDRHKAGGAATKETDVVADEASDDIPFGLDVWVEGVDPIVEYISLKDFYLSTAANRWVGFSIVAIHGLNGHRDKTWTAKNGVNWLRDASMLSAIIPNARIMSWGYNANTHSTEGLSAMYLYDHAQNLVSDLSLHRRRDKVGKSFIIIDSLA
jgi:hypothetical protein